MRDALLRAARAESAAHGHTGTSLAAVAARAGLSATTIAQLFASKEELHDCAVEWLLEELAEDIDAVVTATRTFDGRMDEIVDAVHRQAATEPFLARLLLRATIDGSSPAADRVLAALAAALSLGVAEARTAVVDVKQTAISVLWIVCTSQLRDVRVVKRNSADVRAAVRRVLGC